MNQIDLIRAEIERRKEIYENTVDFARSTGQDECASININLANLCENFLSFLDTLQEKSEKPINPVCEGFDREFSKFSNDVDAEHPFPICVDEYNDFARHFYELGRQSKPKVSEDLETEIERYLSTELELDKDLNKDKPIYIYDCTWEDLKNLARHFAQWQKEKDEKMLSVEYLKGVEFGKQDTKEQMMKEAVEGEVENASFGIVYLRKNLTNDGYSTGDKVRIIIVKED